jgi:hypothetical protein
MNLVPIKDKLEMADRLAVADLLPAAYRRKPANVLVAIEYGDALGMPPIVAMNMIHVIEGKPTLSAQAIGGLVRRAGHKLRVHWDGKAMRATAEIIRADDPEFTFTATWDMDRAKAAKLTGKGVWQQYPDAMLKARAITEVARDACPEALFGVAYTAEELGAETDAEGVPVHVEATHEPVPQESVEERFRKACVDAGIDADEVMRMSAVTEITDETLPRLRAAFKGLKEAAAAQVVHEPEIVEAEVVEETPISKPTKSSGKISNSQRSHLMALATRLEWDRDARISFGNEMLGVTVESWNELTGAQATQLIETMSELADFASPDGAA